jgi:hypothetical protein
MTTEAAVSTARSGSTDTVEVSGRAGFVIVVDEVGVPMPELLWFVSFCNKAALASFE